MESTRQKGPTSQFAPHILALQPADRGDNGLIELSIHCWPDCWANTVGFCQFEVGLRQFPVQLACSHVYSSHFLALTFLSSCILCIHALVVAINNRFTSNLALLFPHTKDWDKFVGQENHCSLPPIFGGDLILKVGFKTPKSILGENYPFISPILVKKNFPELSSAADSS